jgi:hypothetical protein
LVEAIGNAPPEEKLSLFVEGVKALEDIGRVRLLFGEKVRVNLSPAAA